ncbi:MAG TPA: aspartyl/asparaginyl beta-hydroxylase domain-containing protein [Rhizomicrobium sp.]|nr:aspartyl/asparaginyl beta-hydroxylase domain-containing protein [Rhizomicrobium sp.]
MIRLFDCPVDDIASVLPSASSEVWEVDRSRQTTYPVHRSTRSIIFEWLDNDWRIGGPVKVQRHAYASNELSVAVNGCAERLATSYPGARLVRVALAELPPRARIPAHVDNGIGVTAMHRCHVPVVTNMNVHFYIDRVSYFLERGVAYEFDNTRLHAVDNQSDERRVHLLCDFMPASLTADAAQ